MRRLDRVFVPSAIYFITACTAGRRALLSNLPVHDAFVAFANRGSARGAFVGRYILMPEHLHLFVSFDATVDLPAWMKALKNSISKSLRIIQTPAPHWQKGFFDHVLRSAESYEQKWHYVRQNPVRAALASGWEDWPFAGEVHPLEFRRS